MYHTLFALVEYLLRSMHMRHAILFVSDLCLIDFRIFSALLIALTLELLRLIYSTVISQRNNSHSNSGHDWRQSVKYQLLRISGRVQTSLVISITAG